MPRRAHDYRGLTQPRRLQLLRRIQLRPGQRVDELARASDIPLNTVRDHLRVLEDEGLIVRETRHAGTRGRPPVAYLPVTDVGTSTKAQVRVEGASSRGRMLRAVSPDAQSTLAEDVLRQVDVLYEHLDDAGLEPALDEETLSFELAPCRYHALLDEDQVLVCGTHARLVADVLRQTGGPLQFERLDPFVSAHQCRLGLTIRRASDEDPGRAGGT